MHTLSRRGFGPYLVALSSRQAHTWDVVLEHCPSVALSPRPRRVDLQRHCTLCFLESSLVQFGTRPRLWPLAAQRRCNQWSSSWSSLSSSPSSSLSSSLSDIVMLLCSLSALSE